VPTVVPPVPPELVPVPVPGGTALPPAGGVFTVLPVGPGPTGGAPLPPPPPQPAATTASNASRANCAARCNEAREPWSKRNHLFERLGDSHTWDRLAAMPLPRIRALQGMVCETDRDGLNVRRSTSATRRPRRRARALRLLRPCRRSDRLNTRPLLRSTAPSSRSMEIYPRTSS
jgi:hypothetical protein